jgi:hypothetical protein
MKLWNHIVGLSALVAIFSAGLVSAQEQEQAVGVVRISDLAADGLNAQTVSHCVTDQAAGSCKDPLECQKCRKCQNGTSPFLCKECYESQSVLTRLLSCHPVHCHYDPGSGQMKYCDKCGLFGCKCHRHVPMTNAPFGMYKMAYPLDANSFDPRDGGLYAAQGYGVNISVPLAPTVSAAYNYGWGVPSSRMTYISNPIPLPATYAPAIPVQP